MGVQRDMSHTCTKCIITWHQKLLYVVPENWILVTLDVVCTHTLQSGAMQSVVEALDSPVTQTIDYSIPKPPPVHLLKLLCDSHEKHI